MTHVGSQFTKVIRSMLGCVHDVVWVRLDLLLQQKHVNVCPVCHFCKWHAVGHIGRILRLPVFDHGALPRKLLSPYQETHH